MEERPNRTEERTEVKGLSVEELEGLGGSLLPDRIEMRRRRRRRRRSGDTVNCVALCDTVDGPVVGDVTVDPTLTL